VINITRILYDANLEHSSCGVGFITHKKSKQTHKILQLADEALCKIPHRGGMSSEGIGDGAGVNIDISVNFYRYLTDNEDLEYGNFGVANFFYPIDGNQRGYAEQIIKDALDKYNLSLLLWRDVEVNTEAVNLASKKAQLPIVQVVFSRPEEIKDQKAFEFLINDALKEIEYPAFTIPELKGFYPLSMSSYTQVYKGRLVSGEVFPYFKDLTNPEHQIHSLFFHTRFSTNTAPNPIYAQPFRRMAHNGELNTDKKNRLSEDAIAQANGEKVIFPDGQSDSSRLDQTLSRRLMEDKMDIVEAVLAMMPPAWENDPKYTGKVRDMLEYYSLYEEKNDGPAAWIFFDGRKIGARLDRLGLRPLRSIETHDYVAVMSEAGQINFEADTVLKRGRIRAGGMIVFDHDQGKVLTYEQILTNLSQKRDYKTLRDQAVIHINELNKKEVSNYKIPQGLSFAARHVAYSMNQESFKFFLDPMVAVGKEKISAMGFGVAPNAFEPHEGGMSRYFSQRFAQVTNPPLDSIREADGMTLRVSLGRKPNFSDGSTKQLLIESPIVQPQQILQIKDTKGIRVQTIEAVYKVDHKDRKNNEKILKESIESICNDIEKIVKKGCDIIVLSDVHVTKKKAAIPIILLTSAVNQRLISSGTRFLTSIVVETGQAVSTHDTACILGFGASAVCPITVFSRILESSSNNGEILAKLSSYQKAIDKALMKTMGKFGLCTAESYIGGEFFEANFLDTHDPYLAQVFPNINSPIGGASFTEIANSSAEWHQKALTIEDESELPLLGIFKERADGSGHSYGATAVREFVKMTEEDFTYTDYPVPNEAPHNSELVPNDPSYELLGYDRRTPEQIDKHAITPAYRNFVKEVYMEREQRPAAIRDVLVFPFNALKANSIEDYEKFLDLYDPRGNISISVQGMTIQQNGKKFTIKIVNRSCRFLSASLEKKFGDEISLITIKGKLEFKAKGRAYDFFSKLKIEKEPIDIEEVEPAHKITTTFSSGAMSHGALVATAHQAVAQGANIAGALSNSGEGGEQYHRYNSIKASKIKQFASGRFGVWAGYVADPSLEEIEIKIAQGAKPGEGGQLPAKKVNVQIAAARSGTPGVELVSPPPHHDTYSIEDLAQLIHDAKCARVKVIVKLVSSEGIGTIAVGVAKAGADVINIAGNTGGTGAAQVTSLKNSGRVAELGISEVHQALSENGIRDKVVLRCSGAHQTGTDVVKSAILGGDSFEFGTTALMMLKCVIAKMCNVKCPAGLTTNEELYDGDSRALAQYFINLGHEVREILASIGYKSLQEVRGKTHLLNLINHETMVGQLDMSAFLREVEEIKVKDPVYLEANFDPDEEFIAEFKREFIENKKSTIIIEGPVLDNNNKTTGGQFSVDVERMINYQLDNKIVLEHPSIIEVNNGRKVLTRDAVTVNTKNSAGQSFGAFNNSGITLVHKGTCNDGVGKAQTGGTIVVKNPGFSERSKSENTKENVLVGNFALFGAMGGELYVEGQCGDRFGVRNSGAVAVVEGAGDFCCEYMTNGSIVNLGSYGKGFGNGMSGGTAYQYDPSRKLPERCSQDSIEVFPLTENTPLATGNEEALLVHLNNHKERTASQLVCKLLNNWEKERQHFYYIVPKSLINYHRGENILNLLNRKTMTEELSVAVARNNIKIIADSYHKKDELFNGQIPEYGDDVNSELTSKLITATGLYRRAAIEANKISKHDVDRNAKKLIITQERKFMDALYKDMKEAFKEYSDEALAHLLANKRVEDYKEASNNREVADTNALGSTVWVLECDKVNKEKLKDYTSMNKQLASYYLTVLVEELAVAV
jgi:glutamate synthase (NADPH/NADH) large chain